jgi:prepilin-type N-terminal cleavage/methylation domain-containing protein
MRSGPARTTRPRHARTAGFTLTELLVVLVVVAIAAGVAIAGLNSVIGSKVDSAVLEVVSASRYAYGRAISRGNTVRLVFDLDAHTFSVEEAEGRLVLSRVDDPWREAVEEDEDEVVDPWKLAEQRISQTLEPSQGESVFHVVGDGESFEHLLPHRFGASNPFDPGADAESDPEVRIVRFVAPHEPDPRTRGRGYIYYFPNGLSTAGVVQLSDPDGGTVLSVVFDELTGSASIEPYAYEPEELTEDAFDEEQSEVRDPG